MSGACQCQAYSGSLTYCAIQAYQIGEWLAPHDMPLHSGHMRGADLQHVTLTDDACIEAPGMPRQAAATDSQDTIPPCAAA